MCAFSYWAANFSMSGSLQFFFSKNSGLGPYRRNIDVGPLWRDKFQRRLPPSPLPRSCGFNDVDNQASNKVVVFRLIDSLLPARCGGFSSPLFLRTQSSRSIHSERSMKCLPRLRRLGDPKRGSSWGPAAACEPNLRRSLMQARIKLSSRCLRDRRQRYFEPNLGLSRLRRRPRGSCGSNIPEREVDASLLQERNDGWKPIMAGTRAAAAIPEPQYRQRLNRNVDCHGNRRSIP